MKIAMIGLGKMGGGMTGRLSRAGHHVVAYDRDASVSDRVVGESAEGQVRAVRSLADVVAALDERPRVAWVMVPSGGPTEDTVSALADDFDEGDLIVDGGNSNWRDSERRAAELAERGILFADAGTSGGVWGPRYGYCLMVGGSDEAFAAVAPALTDLAPQNGLIHCGPAGSGHFVKMVHNGIEYGIMQSYAEGFELLDTARPDLDLPALARAWMEGSVIRSWLLELLGNALADDPKLAKLSAWVEDSGEGRWTVDAFVEHAVPGPAITAALFARFASRHDDAFGLRTVSALRNQFGGHAVKAAFNEPPAAADPGRATNAPQHSDQERT